MIRWSVPRVCVTLGALPPLDSKADSSLAAHRHKRNSRAHISPQLILNPCSSFTASHPFLSTMATTPAGAADSSDLDPEVEEYEEEVEEEEEEEPSEAEDEPAAAAAAAAAITTSAAEAAPAPATDKWPGWPGDNVFRMIVPVLKVGGIIGSKGELIKKLCEETRAHVRILKGPIGTSDRIVLISGKEEPEADVSPAMDAALRVFKRVNGISETESGPAICSVRLLAPAQQAINLIGKHGASIKSIQESTGTLIRIISGADLPFYAAADERIVDVQGESAKVLKALEAVLGHLRKFLVDRSVVKLFEKSFTAPVAQDRPVDSREEKSQSLIPNAQQTGFGSENSLPLKRDASFLQQETLRESQIQRTGLSLYGEDPAYTGLRSSALGRTTDALVTQITQTMQIPLSYAEDIIGAGGYNIDYIRHTSGAVVRIRETRGIPNEITVEVKGSRTQVQTAHQLIEEFIAGRKEPLPRSYSSLDTGLTSTYSHLDSMAYPSSLNAPSLSGYGYSRYRF